MKYASFAPIILMAMLFSCKPSAPVSELTGFDQYPVYDGNDLGLTYAPDKSIFKLWSPAAQAAKVYIYESALGGRPVLSKDMTKGNQGVWEAVFEENIKARYYTFQIQHKGKWLEEAVDPYAKAVGVNGKRAMIIELRETDPEGWENDRKPSLAGFNDIIIYELHVRDLSIHPESGIKNKGKYLGLTETGTKSPQGESTGIDHISDLGVTHVHLLPVYDFLSVDETKLEANKYNWGYDPQNYNVPEGSYATDPTGAAMRIREFKQMVKAMHDKGLRVIMDVVYNHTGVTETSNFNLLAPGYYYRQNADGSFSNASACGNETASDRPMMRKFIIESVKYWAQEYHIDGFRFDLMGIHDIETMNQVSEALHAIDPTIFIYGEGWTAGGSPLPDSLRALKANVLKLNKVAAFSDDIRDAIKGHVFTPTEKGYISGKPGLEESIKFGVVASTQHPQVNYDSVNYSKAPWAPEPYQTITYESCHDNHTLWDRIAVANPDASEADRIRMNKLAAAIVLTSQGVSFLHAGEEMLRTKNGVENSFESPDEINRFDWSRKAKYKDVVNYYRGLIALRKKHPAFRMPSTALIQKHLEFLDTQENNLVAYRLKDNANGDAWKEILVIYNGNAAAKKMTIPAGNWTIAVNDAGVDEKGLDKASGGQVNVAATSALVLYR